MDMKEMSSWLMAKVLQKSMDLGEKMSVLGKASKSYRHNKKLQTRELSKPETCPGSPIVKNWQFEPDVQLNEKALGLLDNSQTVVELMEKIIDTYGPNPAVGYRTIEKVLTSEQPGGKVFKKYQLSDSFQYISYNGLDTVTSYLRASFAHMGIKAKDNVCILSETRIEWMLTAQALFRNNNSIVTLYHTLGDEGILHGLKETQVQCLVTTAEIANKLRKYADQLQFIKFIIVFETKNVTVQNMPGITTIEFKDFRENGRKLIENNGIPVQSKSDRPKGHDVAILMYTSGSTGIPKAVMITHINLVTAARIVATNVSDWTDTTHDAYAAYLPLAHVLELSIELVAMSYGIKIGYSSPLTLTDSGTALAPGVRGDAVLLKPTILIAVPLILDRIKKAVFEAVAAKGKHAEETFKKALACKIKWQKLGMTTPTLDALIFNKIRKSLGGKVRMIAVGSAPLSEDTQDFIRAVFNCAVLIGYGLTETCGAITSTANGDLVSGNAGVPGEGMKIKLVDWEEGGYYAKEGKGEIAISGNAVTKGYYKNDKLTEELYRFEDGCRWFYTGDIGQILKNGNLKIIDRKKDLVKLQHGEYVALGKIESEVKTLSIVDNVCLIGDSLKTYIIALIVPNKQALQLMATRLGLSEMTFEQLCDHKDINKAVMTEIMILAKQQAFQRVDIPKFVKIVKEEWLPETDLVTAAFKIRRKQIMAFYKKDIEEIYV